MTHFQSDKIFAHLPSEYEKLVGMILDKVGQSEDYLDKFCQFVIKKIDDKELRDHFSKLGNDDKQSACIEHLIIGLTSGEITPKEIKKLI